MGIGAISEAIGLFLMDRNDLGVHSEIMTASHVELVKRGVATGKYKTTHKGKAVAAMVVGGADLEFVDNNPAFELYSVLYTNSLLNIAAQNHQVAVNSTLAIDLTGQAAAESLGPPDVLGHWRANDFYDGRDVLTGRALHYGPALHGEKGPAVPDRSYARAG